MSTTTPDPTTNAPPTSRPRKRAVWIAAAGTAVVLAAAAVSTFLLTRPPGTFGVYGSIALSKQGSSTNECTGSGGYSDIQQGAPVVIYDAAGKIVATGALNQGHVVSQIGYSGNVNSCVFDFTVSNVPANSAFYQVEVSHRGKLTYPANVLKTEPVTLTLCAISGCGATPAPGAYTPPPTTTVDPNFAVNQSACLKFDDSVVVIKNIESTPVIVAEMTIGQDKSYASQAETDADLAAEFANGGLAVSMRNASADYGRMATKLGDAEAATDPRMPDLTAETNAAKSDVHTVAALCTGYGTTLAHQW